MFKRKVLTTLAACIACSLFANAQATEAPKIETKPVINKSMVKTDDNINQMVNIAGRQRMLSQKMAKEAMLIVNNVNAAENKINLKNTIKDFENALSALRYGGNVGDHTIAGTKSSRVQYQLRKGENVWNEYKTLLGDVIQSGTFNTAQMKQLDILNLKLLYEMDKATSYIAYNASKSQSGGTVTAVGLSGKQRMLSQKMSKDFLMISAQYDVEQTKASLEESLFLFERILYGLEEGDKYLGLIATKDKTILKQLKKVNGMWLTFKKALQNGINEEQVSKEQVEIIAEMNIPLLNEVHKMVEMFAST